jgi:hypothetical protein
VVCRKLQVLGRRKQNGWTELESREWGTEVAGVGRCSGEVLWNKRMMK